MYKSYVDTQVIVDLTSVQSTNSDHFLDSQVEMLEVVGLC